MSNQTKFRWPTIGAAGVSLVLSGFTVWWVFSAYHDFRSYDFKTVSAGPIEGTCVEAASSGQLKDANYHKKSWGCGATSKEELANLLAVSVHGMYLAHSITPYTGAALATFDAVVHATQGTNSGYSITRATAYEALSLIGTPSKTSCDAVYGLTAEGADPTPVLPQVVCEADVPIPNVVPVPLPDVQKLYTHCMHAFSYARSAPASGTFGIPKVGKDVKPIILPLIGTNSTTHWHDRSRLLVGTRWGYSTIFYVLASLCSSFFIMDNTVLLLAELTRVDSYFAQNAITEGSGRSMREGMMTMLATFQAKRDFRWAIALILLLLEFVVWILLVGVPWGFGTGMPRPICETGTADHWISPFWGTSEGGWKADWDAFALDVLTMSAHLVIAVAVPISELAQRGGGKKGSRDRAGGGQVEGYTGVAVGSLRSAWWFGSLSVGALVLYVGQSIAAFRFGFAWSDGVLKHEHDEVVVADMLVKHVDALFYMSMTVGLTLGSVVGRWLLAGLSCTSFTIWLIWVLFTVGGFIPPFFVSSYWLFWSLDGSEGQKNCKDIFDGTSHDFAKAACDIRTWTYIVGICLILVAVVGPIFIGLMVNAHFWIERIKPPTPARFGTDRTHLLVLAGLFACGLSAATTRVGQDARVRVFVRTFPLP